MENCTIEHFKNNEYESNYDWKEVFDNYQL